MIDIAEIRLTDDEIAQALFKSKGDIYQLISAGHLKKSFKRYNGKVEIDGEANFFDYLEFSLFLSLGHFFPKNAAAELAEEWADLIGKNALD